MDPFEPDNESILGLADEDEVLGELEETLKSLTEQTESMGRMSNMNTNMMVVPPEERVASCASPRLTIRRLKKNTRLQLGPWVRAWLLISGMIYAYEGMYTVNLPDSLPNGSLNYIFKYYEPFVNADKLLSSATNFLFALSYIKLIEAFLGNAIAITLHYLGVGSGAVLWAYTVTCTSLTRLSFSSFYELTSGMENTRHNNLHDLMLYFVLPKAIMTVMCSAVLFRLGYMLIVRPTKRSARRISSIHGKDKDL
eukprot:CFRG3925T1